MLPRWYFPANVAFVYVALDSQTLIHSMFVYKPIHSTMQGSYFMASLPALFLRKIWGTSLELNSELCMSRDRLWGREECISLLVHMYVNTGTPPGGEGQSSTRVNGVQNLQYLGGWVGGYVCSCCSAHNIGML